MSHSDEMLQNLNSMVNSPLAEPTPVSSYVPLLLFCLLARRTYKERRGVRGDYVPQFHTEDPARPEDPQEGGPVGLIFAYRTWPRLPKISAICQTSFPKAGYRLWAPARPDIKGTVQTRSLKERGSDGMAVALDIPIITISRRPLLPLRSSR